MKFWWTSSRDHGKAIEETLVEANKLVLEVTSAIEKSSAQAKLTNASMERTIAIMQKHITVFNKTYGTDCVSIEETTLYLIESQERRGL